MMTDPAIKLVVSVIDGTILDHKHQIGPDLKPALKALEKREIPFVLASARSPLGIFPIAQELGLTGKPMACYNGALIIQGQPGQWQTLIEHSLDKKEVSRIIDAVKERFPQVSINLYSKADWIIEQADKWSKIEADITKETPLVQNLSLTLLDVLMPIHKLLLVEEAQTIQELFDYLTKLDFKDADFYLSKENYLEVTSKKVSKENALRELADFYQVPLENTMALGDNFNDLPMIRLAGVGVAMANAPQAVKAEADLITLSHSDDGVAYALRNQVLM